MPLTPSQVEEYHEHGFVLAGDILEPCELEPLLAETQRVLAEYASGAREAIDGMPMLARDFGRETGESEGTVYQFLNLWRASEAFRRLLFHERIVEAAIQLTGSDGLQVWCDQMQLKPARSGGCARWHQDAVFWKPLSPPCMVTAWVALEDADERNGCMWMVPGSHRWGPRAKALRDLPRDEELPRFPKLPGEVVSEGIPREVRAVPCPVRAGQVHFHHALTWHGSPANRSDRPRPGHAIHYMPSGTVFTGSRKHPLGEHIDLEPGQPMLEAGALFPVVHAPRHVELERR